MESHSLQLPTATSGHASVDATKTFADITWQNAPKTSPDAWRILDGHTVSKVCFGTLGFHKNPEQEKTFKRAFEAGCNLIDCSLSFNSGEDLKALRKALAQNIEQGHIQRDQIITLSKIQTSELSTFKEQYQQHLHTLSLEKTDYVLLQEPELLTLQGLEKEQLEQLILSLFEWLETLVIKGDIQGYGLSSQTFGAEASSPTQTCLATYAELARTATQQAWGRKKRSSFKIISAPFNLLETELLTEESTWEYDKTGQKRSCSTLDLATRMGISVITQRPLNALSPMIGNVRLIEYPEGTSIADDVKPYLSQIQGPAHFAQVKHLLEEQLSDKGVTAIENALKQENNRKIAPLRAHIQALAPEGTFHHSCINALCSTPGVTSVAHSFTQPQYQKDIPALMESSDMHYIHEIFKPLK